MDAYRAFMLFIIAIALFLACAVIGGHYANPPKPPTPSVEVTP